MKISQKTSFVIALLVIGISGLALEGATHFLQLHFRKERVELAQPLESLPANLGPWVQVSMDEALNPDLEHTLGTSMYLFRDYVDSRVISPQDITAFKDKSATERKAIFLSLQRQSPDAAITMAITYYTGMVDTVSHVPDRCYVADGYDVRTYDVLHWTAGGRNLEVRYLSFDDVAGYGRVSRNVGYFFQVNGKYVSDPIAVRAILANLFARYGYYAKVELMTVLPDRDKSAAIMNEFLTTAMPGIEAVLPDWKQYGAAK